MARPSASSSSTARAWAPQLAILVILLAFMVSVTQGLTFFFLLLLHTRLSQDFSSSSFFGQLLPVLLIPASMAETAPSTALPTTVPVLMAGLV